MDMGRLALSSWFLSGSSQLLLLLMLGTVARVANGCQISDTCAFIITEGVQVSAKSETTITVTWKEVGVDATSYALKLYDRSTFTYSPFTINGSASNFTFTGLVPNRYYSIAITVNCNGTSYVSSTMYDSTLPPKANVTITDKTMTSMSLSWEVTSSNLDYNAHLRDDNNITQASYLLSRGSFTFTDLNPDTNYYAYVETTNLYSSQDSDVVTDRTLPAKVNVSTIAKTATTITVSWNMSSVDLSYYIASVKERQDGPNIAYLIRTTLPQSVTFTSLVPGRNYFVFVTISIKGSNTISVTFTERTLPPQVSVTISVIRSTAMTVSWVAPISDVDYYVLYFSETYNATAVKSVILSSTITSQSFTGLVPGRSYDASVTAYSGNNSQPSAIVTNIASSSYIVLTITSKTTTTMTVSRTNNLPFSFDYWAYLRETESGNADTTFLMYSSEKTFTGLDPGRNYSVSVKASDGSVSYWSDVVMDRTYPASVGDFSCFPYSTENISCSWSLPDGVWSLLFLRVINGSDRLQAVGIFKNVNDGFTVITIYPSNETIIEYPGNGRTNLTFAMLGRLKTNTEYLVNITTYSGDLPSQTLQVKVRTDSGSARIIGPVVGGVLGALVIIVGGVLLYIHRERLSCSKRPDSTQQTSTRKWDDLPAIPSGMKNDACDASHKADNEYMNSDDFLYEDLDNGKPPRDHHSDAPSKTEDDAKTVGSSDPTYLAPDNTYVDVK